MVNPLEHIFGIFVVFLLLGSVRWHCYISDKLMPADYNGSCGDHRFLGQLMLDRRLIKEIDLTILGPQRAIHLKTVEA